MAEAGKKEEKKFRTHRLVDMLDHNGLRGAAAIWVVLHHCFDEGVWPLKLQGSSIMPLFFLLSGFALTIGYSKRMLRPEDSTVIPASNAAQPASFVLVTDKDVETDGKGEAVAAAVAVAAPEVAEENKAQTKPAPPLTFQTYYFNRLLRVMPVYYICFLAAVPPVLNGYGDFPRSSPVFVRSIVTNLIPVCTWAPGYLGFNFVGPAWTVVTLVGMWLFFPALLRYFSKQSDVEVINWMHRLFWLQICTAVVIFVPVLIFNSPIAFPWATFQPLSRLPVFAMGVAAGVLCLRYPEADMPWFADCLWFLPIRYIFVCKSTATEHVAVKSVKDFEYMLFFNTIQLLGLTLVILPLATGVSYAGADIASAFWLQILVPFSQLNIIVAMTRHRKPENAISRFLRSEVMQWLGELSMSIYLVHMVIAYYLLWALNQGRPLSWPDNTGDAGTDCSQYDKGTADYDTCKAQTSAYDNAHLLPPWSFAVIIPLAVLFAGLFVYVIERPINRNFKA